MSVRLTDEAAALAALSRQEVRALTEELHGYRNQGLATGEHMFAVYPEDGDAEGHPRPYYVVDSRPGERPDEWRCDCPWSTYNPGEACKHRAFIAYLTGVRQIPATIDHRRLGGHLQLEALDGPD